MCSSGSIRTRNYFSRRYFIVCSRYEELPKESRLHVEHELNYFSKYLRTLANTGSGKLNTLLNTWEIVSDNPKLFTTFLKVSDVNTHTHPAPSLIAPLILYFAIVLASLCSSLPFSLPHCFVSSIPGFIILVFSTLQLNNHFL